MNLLGHQDLLIVSDERHRVVALDECWLDGGWFVEEGAKQKRTLI